MRSSLRALARVIGVTTDRDDTITGVTADSRHVRPGNIFVAIRGTHLDGTNFIEDAARRGAVAVCVQRDSARRLARLGITLLPVDDPRVALALLAAAVNGEPARTMRLIGITGTLGKTSTALLVQAALADTTGGVGVLGSLGPRVAGRADGSDLPFPDFDGMTTPDATILHRTLRQMADAGVRTAAMEVTSHALAQHRVEGLAFALGVITNLVADEHLDYHGSPERYLSAKARFLEHLAPDAPLVVNADDPLVRQLVAASLAGQSRPVVGVSLGDSARLLQQNGGASPAHAAVRVEDLHVSAAGSRFALRVIHPLPRLEGGVVPECTLAVRLPVLGVQQVLNGALGATAALVAGASPEAVTRALSRMPPVRRRMEVVLPGVPLVIDDTAGHPQTLRAVFASVQGVPRSGLRVVFGLRGSRGVEINERLAAALGEVLPALAVRERVRFVLTWCEDAAGSRDRVQDNEREAALTVLRKAFASLPKAQRLEYFTEPTLAGAMQRLLEDVRNDELVLLLGAQGMDTAGSLALSILAARRQRA